MSHSIAQWLDQLGLRQYAEAFEENAIGLEHLPDLNHEILKDIGIRAAGHRITILKAAVNAEVGHDTDGARPTLLSYPEAERRQLTVLFCDLVGSTELSQTLDPEDMRDINRAYQDACKRVIERYDGYVARYMGDGVLAYFGYPKAHEDDPERAVHAGLGLVESIGELDQEVGTDNAIGLAVRVGIATGSVVVGDLIGEGASQESAVVGDTPNLAARLQSLARPNSVVIAPATRELTAGRFDFEDLGARELKGISDPVQIWKVTGDREGECRFEATHGQRLSPLVGRDEELDILYRRWQRAGEGDGQLVLIVGEAGIGKSRLARALRERIGQAPYLALTYQGSPYHTNSALHPIINQLEHAAGFDRSDSRDEKLRKLEALLKRSMDDIKSIAPLFASFLSIPAEGWYASLELTPEEQKDQTLQALNDQLTGLAAHQPVLFLLEDVHWVDPTTLEAIDLTIRRLGKRRILAVLTHRPQFEAPWTGESFVTVLNLSKLPEKSCATLIESLTGGRSLPEEVTQQIVEKTDGIPLFVEELTKTVLESGLLKEEGGEYVLDNPLPPMAIPETLKDSLMARLDRLASVKDIAQIGAVIGREFSHELVGSVASLSDQDLEQALDRLMGAGLIFRHGTPPQATYIFKHALIQDIAYESLLKSRRQQLHGQIAKALEETLPALVESQPEIAARHLSEAGLMERAVEFWYKAGQQASRRSANQEALSHLGAALEAVDTFPDTQLNRSRKLDLLVESITPSIAVHGYASPELEGIYRQALTLAESVGDTPQIFPPLYARWVAAMVVGSFPMAIEYGREFVHHAERQNARLPLAAARRCMAVCLTWTGKLPGAREALLLTLETLDEAASDELGLSYGQDLLCGVYCYLAITLCAMGRLDAGRLYATQAVERAEKLGHAQTLCWVHTHMGLLHGAVLRDPAALRDNVKPIDEIIEKQEMPTWASTSKWLHGCHASLTGDLERARTLIGEGVDGLESINFSLWRPIMLFHLAEVELLRTEANHAEEYARLGLHEIALGRDALFAPELHRVMANALQAKGAPPGRVEEAYENALTLARDYSAKLLELRAAVDLARYWRGRGKTTEAQNILQPIYGQFTEGFDMPDLENAKSLLEPSS